MSGSKSWFLTRSAYECMAEHAERDYPEETCGFLFGEGSGLEVVPMRNIQNELHRKDPERWPRDARTAYYFDPEEMARVLLEKEREGKPLRAIYHSHPDHDAYFSETDSAAAAPFGEPSYPGAVYLVFSVRKGKVADLKAFDWCPERGRYVEIPIRVG